MSKFPLTIIPLILIAVVWYLFTFVVPSGQDLISENGDTLLGIFTGALLAICVVLDIRRYTNKSSQ